jgi:hypothetical protein
MQDEIALSVDLSLSKPLKSSTILCGSAPGATTKSYSSWRWLP